MQRPVCLLFFFYKNGPFPAPFLYFRLFHKQLTVNKCSIKVANDWIRTRVLSYRKRPLCQLRHNHCLLLPMHNLFIKDVYEWHSYVWLGMLAVPTLTSACFWQPYLVFRLKCFCIIFTLFNKSAQQTFCRTRRASLDWRDDEGRAELRSVDRRRLWRRSCRRYWRHRRQVQATFKRNRRGRSRILWHGQD